jgi:hypothetical protein
MSTNRQDVLEELAHKKELVQAFTRRRRPLEIQAAHRGLNTPPEVLTEISILTDQIRAYEDEITRLETHAAEDELPLSEVEFRVLLAETWDTPRGRPTVAGVVRLELARLQLGIVPERAKELERDIRIGLAQESFTEIDPADFRLLCTTVRAECTPVNVLNPTLCQIGRSIRLDPETAYHLLFVNLSPDLRRTLDTQVFRDILLYANKVHQHSEDFLVFNRFLIELIANIDSDKRKNAVHE